MDNSQNVDFRRLAQPFPWLFAIILIILCIGTIILVLLSASIFLIIMTWVVILIMGFGAIVPGIRHISKWMLMMKAARIVKTVNAVIGEIYISQKEVVRYRIIGAIRYRYEDSATIAIPNIQECKFYVWHATENLQRILTEKNEVTSRASIWGIPEDFRIIVIATDSDIAILRDRRLYWFE